MAEGRGQRRGTVSNGGYNKRWFGEKARLEYTCGICDQILKDPQQIIVCGHQFCLSCLPAEVRKCPTCNKDIKANEVFPDESVRKKVIALAMKCPSKRCKWKGTLQEFEQTHKDTCPQDLVKCSNEGCPEVVTRGERQKHLQDDCEYRKIDCRHCASKITIVNEKTHYDKDCLRIPVACPQQCMNDIPREEIQNHVDEECEKTLINCMFRNIGCEEQVERAKLQEHNETVMQEHLTQLLSALENLGREKREMSEEINQLQDTASNLTNELRDSNEREETRASNIESELKEFKELGSVRLDTVQQATEQNFDSLSQIVLQSGEFQETLLFIQHELSTMINIKIPQLQAICQAHENENKKLAEKHVELQKMIVVVHNRLRATIKSLRDELDSRLDALCKEIEEERRVRMENEAKIEDQLSKLNDDITENSKELERQSMTLTITKDKMEDNFSQHAKQMQLDYDNLAAKITKERESRKNDFLQLNQEIASVQNTRISIWRVDDVESSLTQLSTKPKKAIYGRAFYTEPHGYHIQPKIFFNGARQKDEGYLSIFIQILKGKFDPILKWPFGKHVRFTLLEQEGQGFSRDLQKDLIPETNAEELQRPTEDANYGFGIYKFVSHEVLRAGRYIVDDTMFVKIEVLGNEHSETI